MVEDLVQGTVRVANAELDDMIILRSDGTPTYNHSVVVDDHDMEITHVIRGDDHLTNTFRQVPIYQAMGWELPRFAHIPLIHGADGAKLSKRHGAVSVLEFREQGYLPEALCNYLLRLGWGHGDVEVLDRDEAIRLFDLDGVGRAPSRMDYAKLTNLNGIYIRQADDDRLTGEVLERLAHRTDICPRRRCRRAYRGVDAGTQATRQDAGGTCRRSGLPGAAVAACRWSRRRPRCSHPRPGSSCARSPTRWRGTDFTPTSIDLALRDFAAATGRKLGQVAQPLRAALTGSTASPGIDATLAALGKDEALARLRAAI